MATLIVIGGTGELGSKVLEAACSGDVTGWPGEIVATYHSSPPFKQYTNVTWQKLDCGDHKAVRSLLAEQQNLGAVLYCAVPKHGGATGKGGDFVRMGIVDDVVNCAEAVVMLGARFVAVSTDLVFDGRIGDGESYTEESATCPPNPYGKYKEEMERQLLKLSGKVVIARTSLILTDDDGEFGKDDLGLAMVELAKDDCGHVGLIHMVSDEVSNRWELAKLLAKKLGIENKLGIHAKSGLSAESGLNRPLNCSLSTKVRQSVLKTRIRGITERLS